jgi:D-alanine-D-alanine ligase
LAEVGVLFGGPSPEHDVSVLTGLQAVRALAATPGRVVRAIYWTKLGEFFLVEPGAEAVAFAQGAPRGSTPLRLAPGGEGGFVEEGGRFGRARRLDLSAVVLCTHGGPGEDGTLQGALDLAGVAYAGPTVPGAALGMDKLSFGAVVEAAGLATLPRFGLDAGLDEVGFVGPYIVKPRFGGSSIGVEVVADLATAKARLGANQHLRAGAVLEPYREDYYDLQIAVRSWPVLALSGIERPLRATSGAPQTEILGYSDKYVGPEGMASAPRELPAVVSDALGDALRDAARRVAVLAGLRGVARIDFLSDGTDFVVNEINTIPGSLARYLWIDPPVPFEALLDDLLAEAVARPTHQYSAAGADGTVLRGAASIAAKLA